MKSVSVPNLEIDETSLYIQYLDELSTLKTEYEMVPELSSKEKEPQDGFEKTITGLFSTFFFTGLAEIGDKTFLMVVVYASKKHLSNFILFACPMLGLAIMHTFGSLFGGLFQLFLSQYVLYIISCSAFFLFGIVLIYQGCTEEEEEIEEKMKEVENEVNETMSVYSDGHSKAKHLSGFLNNLRAFFSHPATKLFLMTLLSEMGDRSQITAVALAATYNIWLVIIGGILGHMIAMLLAIICGKIISQKVSENTITIIGGILFILFSMY